MALALGGFGYWKGLQVKVGDLHRGVPELRASSRYNIDSAVVTSKFSIGVDVLNVIVETKPEGCVDHAVMSTIDDFSWHMVNLPGVQSAVDLPGVAKTLNAGWNEGYPKWRVLSRNRSVLTQSVTYVQTSTGLLNSDCSVMPVMLFTRDHKAETIEQIVAEAKRSRPATGTRTCRSSWPPATSVSWPRPTRRSTRRSGPSWPASSRRSSSCACCRSDRCAACCVSCCRSAWCRSCRTR